ncbi:MAG: LacI family transcriptional regulator [Phycisphaerae bacterium]|nr:LacI family transcriptional regulator [Phycisphaerae bacterium]
MAVTVSDIAKRAVVSVGTVSRVLNNQPNIGSERKQKVLTAIEDLNYKSDEWVSRMRKGLTGTRTGQIALVLINLPDQTMHAAYMMQYIHGIQQESAEEGRKCLFVTWNDKPGDDAIPHILLDEEVDGIVFKGILKSETSRRWLSRYPRIALNHSFAPPDCDSVMVDYEGGAYDSVNYLAARGHRRIAFVDLPSFYTKFLGYRHAVNELGLDVDEELIQTRDICFPLKSESELDRVIENLWSLSEPPTAIISSDYYCGTIYKALASRGLKVPDDVSIIGCDNAVDHCEALIPKLTSVDIGAVELGKLAVTQLFERIQKPQERYRKLSIRGRIVERDSVREI